MTDGNDDSSLLNTNSDPLVAVTNLFELAQSNQVAIYCVAFGSDVNTNSLNCSPRRPAATITWRRRRPTWARNSR